MQDETLTFEVLGGSAINAGATVKIETDCNIEGFHVVDATAMANGKAIDLVKAGRVDFDTYKPLTLAIGK